MHSIRSKILLAYLGLAAGLIAMVLFAWADLRFVEQKIAQGQRLEVMQGLVQELRRHEKNTLLYRQPEEQALARQLIDRLQTRLDDAELIIREDARHLLKSDLSAYQTALNQIDLSPIRDAIPLTMPAATEHAAENTLRQIGHRLSTRIDTLADSGAAQLRDSLSTSKNALLIFASVVLSLTLLVAFALIRAVVRPLRELERNLKPLAEGRFDALPEISGDREMVSLVQALKRMLDELDRRRRQVLQSEKLASLGVLAAGVAHELTNPLGNISAAAQILQEEAARPQPGDLRRWTQQIDEESTRAQNIVRALLDYAYRKNPSPAPTRLHDVIDKSLALLRNRFPTVAQVTVDLPENATVHADPQRLQQVFINLIGNALDTEPPSERVTVHITGQMTTTEAGLWPPSPTAHAIGAPPPGSPLLLVCVSDDGPGIDPELWPKIFDPFFTTRAPGRGIGLGLFVVAEILQEQGASVSIDAAPNGGARFCLAFPVPAEPTTNMPPAPASL